MGIDCIELKWSNQTSAPFSWIFVFLVCMLNPFSVVSCLILHCLRLNFEETVIVTCCYVSCIYSTRDFGGIQGSWGLMKMGTWLMSSWMRLFRKARSTTTLAQLEGSNRNSTRNQPVLRWESRLLPLTATSATAWNTKGNCSGCEWICNLPPVRVGQKRAQELMPPWFFIQCVWDGSSHGDH